MRDRTLWYQHGGDSRRRRPAALEAEDDNGAPAPPAPAPPTTTTPVETATTPVAAIVSPPPSPRFGGRGRSEQRNAGDAHHAQSCGADGANGRRRIDGEHGHDGDRADHAAPQAATHRDRPVDDPRNKPAAGRYDGLSSHKQSPPLASRYSCLSDNVRDAQFRRQLRGRKTPNAPARTSRSGESEIPRTHAK
jgi:hypothetical protein